MIISASRRTDIPAYYSEWFFKRLEAKEVLVRNPMNHHQVSRVSLDPALVDCLVFWTKNPKPMLQELHRLAVYKYYFTYSLNPYGRPIENNLPDLETRITTFRSLADRIGADRMVWRYDPIILTDTYDLDYHRRQFEHMVQSLEGKTHTCVFSFLRPYPKVKKRIAPLNYTQPSEEAIMEVLAMMVDLAKDHGMVMESCSESMDLSKLGVKKSRCIDDRRISRLLGQTIRVDKDKNQREVCGCVKSIDIGTYNTCHHDCIYCYANLSKASVKNKTGLHDETSPFLIGHSEEGDRVKDREMTLYGGPEQLKLDI